MGKVTLQLRCRDHRLLELFALTTASQRGRKEYREDAKGNGAEHGMANARVQISASRI
jgi:hypothetical protein